MDEGLRPKADMIQDIAEAALILSPWVFLYVAIHII